VSLAIFYALLKNTPALEISLFDTTLYDLERITSDKAKEEHLQVRPFDFGSVGVTLKKEDVFQDFVQKVRDFDPDLIAMSCNEVTYPLGLSLLEKVAAHRSLKLVGGVLATFVPEELLKNPCIDMVCVGEGEGVLIDLVEKLQRGEDPSGIRNLCVKKHGSIVRNPLRPALVMDELPMPDFDIFERGRLYRPMAGKVWRLFPIETSRGCPYQCAYCNSPSQKKLYQEHGGGPFFRKKSMERIAEELRQVVSLYGAEYIYFLSDTLLCLSDREFDAFIAMYEEFRLPFWCQNRPEMVSYERMKRLKEVGCHRMSIGVEHGNEEFRRRVLKKNVKNSVIIRAFDILAEVGIPASVNNIIGFPGETRELAWDTVSLNRKLKFDNCNAYAFMPFRGTELYDVCLRNGFITPRSVAQCVTLGSILKMPQFSKEEIDGLTRTFALYAKMPETYFDQIRRAEKDDEDGRRIFRELSAIYKQLFFEPK